MTKIAFRQNYYPSMLPLHILKKCFPANSKIFVCTKTLTQVSFVTVLMQESKDYKISVFVSHTTANKLKYPKSYEYELFFFNFQN